MGAKSTAAVLFCLAAMPLVSRGATLTFDECVRLAVQNNAALHNASANVIAAEQRGRAAYGGFYPQVSGDLNYVDRSGSAAAAVGDTTSYSTSVTVTQNLFAGFQDQARVEQAAANLDIAQATLASAKAQLSRDLKTAFAGLAYAQDNVRLTQDILQRLEGNLRLVELRFESGRENKGSLLLSQASVAQGRFDRLQAEQALASAQAQLATLIGLAAPANPAVRANEADKSRRAATPPTDRREVIPPQLVPDLHVAGAVPLSAPPDVPDYGAMLSAAPDLRDALARERSAAADVRLARAGFYPTVSVSGSIGREGSTWFPSQGSRVVSANVSIPLYSGGRDYYGERGALAALDAARANRDSVEGEILVRLKQTYAAYVESVEQLSVADKFVTAAETRAVIARARYENGLMTFEDWDRIENDLIQRRKALLAASRDRVGAEAAFELAQGAGAIP